MDKITFEQLPQAVSLLIEKVGQLADKVDEALSKSHAAERQTPACLG